MADASGSAEPDNDAHLLDRVVQGDLTALELLFGRYQRRVYQLALGVTRDPGTADEVLQDTFYRLYTNAAQLDSARPLLPWLYRVAANLAYNQVRRRRFWPEPLHALAERLRVSARRLPEHLAEKRELQSIVRLTLDTLSPNHRAVLVLHYIHEHSVQEIAEILECPEGTVKSRLHHARKLLRDQLERSYGGTALLPDQI